MTFLVAVALTLAPAAPAPDLLPEASRAMDQIAVYVHDQERANIEATMADAAEQFGEWLKQITPPPPPTPAHMSPSPTPALGNSGTGGGVPTSSSFNDCGQGGGGNSPIPAYITYRESHDSYCAVNSSSGAFGRYQFMPATWSSSCSDLPRTPDGQDQCATRISNGGSNLAPWR